MTEKLNYLGWGIVGTPKGRQQVNEGVTKQLTVSFDLPQEIGGCLPSPKETQFIPLYYLKSRALEKNWVLGFAEYFSVFEQGQTRAGTYLGSFIHSVNSIFSENQITNLFASLRHLTQFQTEHFIDVQTRSYIQQIEGQPILSPMENLSEIAQELQVMPQDELNGTEVKDSLYIEYEQGDEQKLLGYLLKGKVFYRYKNIYFSSDEYISSQVRKKNIAFWTFSQLKIYVESTELYRQYVQHQHQKLQQQAQEIHSLQQTMHEKIAQQVTLQERVYSEQVNQILAERNAALEERDIALEDRRQSDILANLGSKLVQEVSNNAERLETINLVKFANSSAEKNNFLQEFGQIRGMLATLQNQLSKADFIQQEPLKIESRGWKILSAVFIPLSLFLFGLLAWDFFSEPSQPTKEQIEDSSIYKELYQQNEGYKKFIDKLKSEPKINLHSEKDKWKKEICSVNDRVFKSFKKDLKDVDGKKLCD